MKHQTSSSASSPASSSYSSTPLRELCPPGGKRHLDGLSFELLAYVQKGGHVLAHLPSCFSLSLSGSGTTGALTIKPVDGRFGRRRVIERDGGFTLQPAGSLVRVQVDHKLTRLFVHLQTWEQEFRDGGGGYAVRRGRKRLTSSNNAP